MVSTLMGMAGFHASSATIVGLHDELLLRVPFEGTLSPHFANGSADVECPAAEFGEGVVGKGITLTDSTVSVLGEGNFHRPCGTVAFWVSPAWTSGDASFQGHRQLFDATNFAINYFTSKQITFFMTGKTKKGTGYRWDYGVTTSRMRSWRPGEWHHVAAIWDASSGRKTLFLDGVSVASGTTEWLRDDPYMGTCRINLGHKVEP